ncbi:MAG: response regulator transcription factor [Bryobacteraceae bacterium]
MPTDVLLVDDHVVVRDGIKAILERGGEFKVTGEAENGTDAVSLCKKSPPHMVLMDISLPGLNGIEATTEILRHCPNAKVVVLSMLDDEVAVMNAMRAGARGFVLKRASLSDLLDAMRTVAKGGSYLSPQVSDRLLRRIQSGNLHSNPISPLLEGLSRREVQVLRLVAEGKSSKEIADILGLELETVRSYRKTMMKKLRVNNAASLTKVAVAAGLIGVAAPSYIPGPSATSGEEPQS